LTITYLTLPAPVGKRREPLKLSNRSVTRSLTLTLQALVNPERRVIGLCQPLVLYTFTYRARELRTGG